VSEPAFALEPAVPVVQRSRALPASVWFATMLGLLVAYRTVLPTSKQLMALGTSVGLSPTNAWAATAFTLSGVGILLIFGIVLFIERRPLASLGLGRPRMSDLGVGIAVFLGAAVIGAIYRFTLTRIFPHSLTNIAPEQVKLMITLPIPAALALAVGAGFGEEIGERGFAFDRLRSATGSASLAIVMTLGLSMAAHFAFWGWRYAIMIGPTELILILVYWWRRNLWPNIIAHTLVDSFPVVARTAIFAWLGFFGAGSYYHDQLAQFHYENGSYADAVQEYSKAIEAAPSDTHLLSERADAEVMNRDYAQAIGDLDSAIGKKPGDPDLQIQRAMAYYYAGFYQKAKDDADKAVAAAPKDWTMFEQRAEIEKWLNQPDHEIADLDQAIRLSKTPNADLYRDRGQAFLDKHDNDRGVRDLKKALEIDGNNTATLTAIADAYYIENRYPEEIAILTRSLKIDPDDTNAYMSRADAYTALGQYQQALDDYRSASKHAPGDSDAANDMSWLLSTCPLAKLRDGKRALALANYACEQAGWDEPKSIDTLAAAYAEMGNYEEAVVWQQRAIDLAGPSDKDFQQQLQQRLELYRKGLPYREAHLPG
jgi:tetratricopeptide (TPR) repeat protein